MLWITDKKINLDRIFILFDENPDLLICSQVRQILQIFFV